ncbi:hypothetical protein [Flavobacterium sp. 102]|uniref:hypothetical protein n=1 Tax=Flavobacterium sp. 102 TaxID=2135623 RepID=UPI000EB02C0D|nr:hypothetical protein [Flavobacterium sp. 102]RKS02858.1 hypothetical protein C8C84_2588 [Flavobacterium sp. 102]
MNRVLLIFLAIIISSCNFNKAEDNVQTIDPKNIKLNEVIHDSLSKEQIHKIEKIQSTFAEVYPVSLEETITNFKRDQNPDSEIEIWLEMANTYEKYLNSENKLDLKTKKEVFKLILSRSMMPEEEAIENSKLEILTKDKAKKVLSYYSMKADPIDVEEH